MTRSRLGLRAIGLCLALAGLIAVSASVAQADPKSYWLFNGVKVTTLLPTLQGSLENNHGTLLGMIGFNLIHILCTAVTFSAGYHLLNEGGLLGKVRFTGCKVLGKSEGVFKVLPSCEPFVLSPGGTKENGVIESTVGKGLIKLHNGTPMTLVEPNAGTTFATILTGEECSFGEQIVVGGKLAVQDCESAFLTDKVTHLISEYSPLTELYLNNSKANKATIDGSGLVSLAGEHKAKTFAGHPE